ncbi:hypothetical protein [Streptomyces noursei]|uniref:hypothetical protein n=1 Tax=Streptomyces noursei TaxID=1971 RepID=UPI000F560D6A|nr:hypothetical protein [Streptomyces noursei]UWS76894.1 hypothetical protein N1H47_40015 [Streptomyces noursei]
MPTARRRRARDPPAAHASPHLPHEVADPLPLDKDLLLGAREFGFGVQCPLTPGCFDPVVFGLASGITAGAAVGDDVLDECPRVRILVQERGGNVDALGDGADSHAAAVAAELADGCCHAAQLVGTPSS